MARQFNKIFGIGLSKTGTTSLTAALNILGIRSVHYPRVPQLHELLLTYQAATDTSVAAYFSELDQTYPRSLFILTMRDNASWVKSARVAFKRKRNLAPWQREVRNRLYGSTDWKEDLWCRQFARHNDNVSSYFKHRKRDLLKINIINGGSWTELCEFLDVPVPSVKFPFKNRTHYASN
jgi:hypothetical protein